MKVLLLTLVLCFMLLAPASALYNLKHNMKNRKSIKEALNKEIDEADEIINQEKISEVEVPERSLGNTQNSQNSRYLNISY